MSIAMAQSPALDPPPSILLVEKPRPAKVTSLHAHTTFQSAMRLINHVQVLVYAAPSAIHFLEHWGRALRPTSTLYLTAPTRADDRLGHRRLTLAPTAERVSTTQLLDLLPVLTPDRPIIVATVDPDAHTHAVEELRRGIIARLADFGPADLATTDVLTKQLATNRVQSTQ